MKNTQRLEMLLKSLHLPAFTKNYAMFAEKAQKAKLGYAEFLLELAQIESDERQNNRVKKLLKESKLPSAKNLQSFDVSGQPALSLALLRELSAGDCLDNCENILVFGVPGTGKSHLAAALGREWCLRGRKVYYTTAAALVQELLVAKRDLQLNDKIKKLDAFEALIIDDISYIPQSRDETDVLFTLLAARYEVRSLVVTSNLVFSAWNEIFKDPMTTKAAVDRLVHHGTIIELVEVDGDTFREKQAKARKRRPLIAATV